MSRRGALAKGIGPEEERRAHAGRPEVVLFRVGRMRFVVARDEVRSIRRSPRMEHARTVAGSAVPVVSFSTVLGLDRDTSVDQRVIDVEHWGRRVGLEVTAIEGIRLLEAASLHPLPPLVARGCRSRSVLGIVDLPGGMAVALDLATMLVERGVEVPEADGDGGGDGGGGGGGGSGADPGGGAGGGPGGAAEASSAAGEAAASPS